MGSLADFAKRVKLAQAFEGLTNQVTEYTAKYELVTSERAKYTPAQLAELVQVGPLGEQVTRESIIAAQEKDARDVVVCAKTNLENLQAQIAEDDVAFTKDEADEVMAQVTTTQARMSDLKMPIISKVPDPVILDKP